MVIVYIHGISYKKKKIPFEFKSDSTDSESEYEDTSLFSINLNEKEQNSDLIPNKNENQSFDLFSLSSDEFNNNNDTISLNDKSFGSIKSKGDKNDSIESGGAKNNLNSTKLKQDDDKLTNLNQKEIDDSVTSDEDLKSILDENESFSDFYNFWF